MLRRIYHALIPEEWRFWLYKVRNRQEVESVRRRVFESPRGNFSLRRCDDLESIFIHVPKAAGTSVARSLFGELPYHYTAVEHRVIFGHLRFNQYFKFAFVRNPWDRLYSAYSYLKAGGWDDSDQAWFDSNLSHLPDFESFVLEWLRPSRLKSHMHLRPQFEFVTSGRGKILVDYLGYFETIESDYREISSSVGASEPLVHSNASPRSDYRTAYSEKSRESVGELYRRDIDLFGYEFEGIKQRKVVSHGQLISA